MDFRVLGFISPEYSISLDRESQDIFEHLAKRPVVWDEDKTLWSKQLVLDAKSWSPQLLFPDEPHLLVKSKPYKEQYRISPGGKWGYVNRIMKRGIPLDLYQGNRRGKVGFTEDVVIPNLVETRYWDTYMSITPAECLTQRAGIRKATGKVVIGGLGMGWLLRKVAQKRSVREIIVVEICEDLLDWYGYNLCERISHETNTPIKVICDDVLNHMGRHGDETRYLVDIWKSYPEEYWGLSEKWQRAIGELSISGVGVFSV